VVLAPFVAAAAVLDEIPGIGRVAAAIVVAEVGVDMSRFPTAGHLCSWAKFSPGISSSPAKPKATALPDAAPATSPESSAKPRAHRHVPGCPISVRRETPRQETSHRRHRPFHPRHRPGPLGQPRHPLPRPRCRSPQTSRQPDAMTSSGFVVCAGGGRPVPRRPRACLGLVAGQCILGVGEQFGPDRAQRVADD